MSREGDCSSNSFGNWSPESQLEDVEMQGASEVFRVEGSIHLRRSHKDGELQLLDEVPAEIQNFTELSNWPWNSLSPSKLGVVEWFG